MVGASLAAVSSDLSLSDPVPPQYSWYYCEHPQGYYPAVQQCPEGWRPVTPPPPPLSVPPPRDHPSGTGLPPSGPPPHERTAPGAVVQVQRQYDTDDSARLFSAPDLVGSRNSNALFSLDLQTNHRLLLILQSTVRWPILPTSIRR